MRTVKSIKLTIMPEKKNMMTTKIKWMQRDKFSKYITAK